MKAFPRAAALVLIVLAELVLAGCTAGTDASGQAIGRPDAQFDASTGAILGLVLTQDELPIPGAQVGIIGPGTEATVITTETGEFVFSRLSPGTYTLTAVALGYSSGQSSVTVAAGEVTEGVLVTLEQAASIEPYSLTETARRTISAFDVKPLPQCYYAAEYAPVPAPFGTLKTCAGGTLSGCSGGSCFWNWTSILQNNSNWKTIMNEGMWTGSSAVTGRSFSIDLATPSYRSGSYNYNDKEVFVDEGNDPPLVIRVDYPDTLVEREIDTEKEYCCGWHTRLFGASCTNGYCYAGFGPDYGVLIDQTIDLYFSFGFNAPLPEGFTAVSEDE